MELDAEGGERNSSDSSRGGRFALVLIDFQPEWYSQSHVATLFPHLGKNVERLLGRVRNTCAELACTLKV